MSDESTAIVPVSDVEAVIARVEKIQDLMRRAMKPDMDYGHIPGMGSKPTLLKPGAEKLCVMFKFSPRFKTVKHYQGDHLTVESTCEILSTSGEFLGDASATCSTRESKFAYRKANRKCPQCGKETIIKGRAEYGGGWVCWKKQGGCGMNYHEGATEITSQPQGRIANEDIPDQWNTVLRMAEKRAYLAAVRLVTGCSAIFDEEFGEAEKEAEPNPNSTAKEDTPKPMEHDSVLQTMESWKGWLAEAKPDLATLNEVMPRDWHPIKDAALRSNIWHLIDKYADEHGWYHDRHARKFVERSKT